MLNDLDQVAVLPEHALELIGVPVLIVHSPTDPVVPYSQAEDLAHKVTDARLLGVPEGGHLCLVTNREWVVPEVSRFLAQHAPENTILSRELPVE
jgi:pimeloyl-ACP methyl ester carboxylesterase